MRLYEVINDGDDSHLIEKLFYAINNQEEREAEEAQSLLVASLLNKGWDRVAINKLIDMVRVAGDEKDLSKVIMKMITGDSIFESIGKEVNIHTCIITIPAVEEKNKKQAIIQLATKLQLKGMLKIISLKLLPSPSFQIGGQESEKIINLRLKLKIKSRYDRYRILSFIGNDYHVERLSYNDVDKT